MNAHTRVATIQEYGCWALANIAAADETKLNVAEKGGIKAVVAAMKAYLNNAFVQENGCAALGNIAMLAENQPKVAAAGGIEAVVAAMNKYSNNADIKKNGCAALRNIANNNMNTIQLIQESVDLRIINRCPELENILDDIDKMIELRIGFINNNKYTLSCEELLENIRYFDKHIYKNRTVTRCGHVFHTDCLDRWKKYNNTCPNCRKELKVGGNSEDEDENKEKCPICLKNFVIKNEDIFNEDIFKTVSASYNVFKEILDKNKCNDDELKKRIDGYKPNEEPSSAIAGGKKKQLKSKKKMI